MCDLCKLFVDLLVDVFFVRSVLFPLISSNCVSVVCFIFLSSVLFSHTPSPVEKPEIYISEPLTKLAVVILSKKMSVEAPVTSSSKMR